MPNDLPDWNVVPGYTKSQSRSLVAQPAGFYSYVAIAGGSVLFGLACSGVVVAPAGGFVVGQAVVSCTDGTNTKSGLIALNLSSPAASTPGVAVFGSESFTAGLAFDTLNPLVAWNLVWTVSDLGVNAGTYYLFTTVIYVLGPGPGDGGGS